MIRGDSLECPTKSFGLRTEAPVYTAFFQPKLKCSFLSAQRNPYPNVVSAENLSLLLPASEVIPERDNCGRPGRQGHATCLVRRADV